MHQFRLSQAAAVLGVSDDTVRRWVDAGRLPSSTDAAGRRVVDGADLAGLAVAMAGTGDAPVGTSARNSFPGIVTRVLRGDVGSQVEVQSGPHRLVSLVTTESVDDLQLVAGAPVRASVKATHVVVDLP